MLSRCIMHKAAVIGSVGSVEIGDSYRQIFGIFDRFFGNMGR